MLIKNIANPNRANETTDCCLKGEMDISWIDSDMLITDCKYIGVLDEDGKKIGAIQTERLLYLIEKIKEISFLQILEHLNEAVIAIDNDSRIFYVNEAYYKVLNVSPGKIIGRYIKEIEPDAALLTVLNTGEPMRIERQLIRTVDKYVSVNMFPLLNNDRKQGACSIFTDVTELKELTTTVERITQEAENYKEEIRNKKYLDDHRMICESDAFKICVQRAVKVAKTDATVLIRGENGTGKEGISNLIQQQSKRWGKPFVKVNCAAIPESLLESELFGYEEGAFTGAKKGGRAGKFELADGGTIFLDEIGDINLPMQVKLLRVLQEGEIEKIGASKAIPVNVRVIAATNQPLEKMIQEGKFRMDLFYRLNVVSVEIPPLRERKEDIIPLANEFLRQFNEKYSMNKSLSSSAMVALMTYSWPGNIREIKNIIESAVVLSAGDQITKNELPFSYSVDEELVKEENEEEQTMPELLEEGYHATVEAFEKKLIMHYLEKNNGSRKQTMEELGLTKRTFYRKLSDLKIE